jgi:uncharacterized protein with FMN-binding domain
MKPLPSVLIKESAVRHKLLSLAGFSLGLLAILFAYPPNFMENPNFDYGDGVDLVEPEVKPDGQLPTPSPVEVTSSPTPTATRVTTSPTAVATTASIKTIIGGSFSAGKYGEVQIKATASNGVLTSVTALKYPDADSRSLSISEMAIPILTSQTLAAMYSADIQGATGASYTSAAWIQSLQSILSQL